MCGVIGLVSEEPVVHEILIGLTSLQHRGQDAAGVAVFDDKDYYFRKSKGLVGDVFSTHNLDSVRGTVGVGHTRYPTAGSNSERDAHPFLVDASCKIALVQNGNVTNYFELKDSLKREGIFLESRTDAEALSKILAYGIELSGDLFYAVERLMEKIRGSYSVVVAIEDKGLLAFRDPYGFRPLIIGRKHNSYCIASESVAFETLGYKRVRDVAPGEAVLIDRKLNVISRIVKEKERAHCMFEWVYFARPDSIMDGRSVYNARLKLGKQIAQKWDKEIDVVIPVPDSARTAAIKFAEVLGARYREGLIKNRYLGRTFIMPTQKKREHAVRLKLNPIIASVKGRRVALIDDSIVRGTTSKKMIKLLREAGAKEVHFVSTCPPIKHPCHYGVDFPTKKELIASDKSVEQIRQEIGADSVTYQSLEDLEVACKKTALCTACLTGKYPSSITSKQKIEMAKSRITQRSL